MKINVIGGGPGGLYFAIQMKLRSPAHDITVYERNAKGSTFGWGVVFSDETIDNFLGADAVSSKSIKDALFHWDDIDVHFNDTFVRTSGHGFSGISRQELLDILDARATELGVKIVYESFVEDIAKLRDADLVICADGIFSRTRDQLADKFQPDIEWRTCKYIWLGTSRLFGAFTFFFKETEHGWFTAHCYRFSDTMSTFIVETPETVWKAHGIDRMEKEEGIAFCEKLFAEYLEGHPLITNADHLRGSAVWINFPRINCERWHYENVVLLGDSAASAHFSIGSGTKLAMESAISLATLLHEEQDREKALDRYQEERRTEVLRLQSAAKNSTEWFENVRLKMRLPPEQFVYSLLTRSQRVSHENLRVRDQRYLEGLEEWFATQGAGRRKQEAEAFEKILGGGEEKSIPYSLSPFPCAKPPPMFTPFKLRGMELVNRVVVSPMDMYSAVDGVPGDFHLVHLGARALGGAGLVFTEMTCISREGRITPGCAGIWNNEQASSWKRIVDFIHQNSPAKVALQLGHSGRKGSTRLAWDGMDEPLDSGNWELIAPSAIAYTNENQVPREMTREDMDKVLADFVNCTKRGADAGFDLLELHCAHGYLLSTFLSPLTNVRADEYGGSLENRLRFPLDVFEAMRAAWPSDRPMSVRISATDWVEGGNTVEEAVQIAKAFAGRGLDIIDVSAGQVHAEQQPVYGRMFQTPFSDRIRAETGMPTMAVGNIYEVDHVNSIIMAGRADLCLLARPHLSDPHWTLRAAAQLGYADQWWPKQYDAGKSQLYRNLERAKAMEQEDV
ncbi:MAG: bifunctional salicylyl-CoA 5-hydroxylase/oxidoreductase [Planctomycetes bacterium]|nr:bifunctional salicylyl-CoA 5-hydroxylase/oxidoreductase [Planctomycetota bacterium]